MLPTHHTAYTVAILFMDLVGKLHRMPRSLVSDCDPLFLSKFWQELFCLSGGTKLQLSYAYHPQSDGQPKVLNRVIEQYLRAFVHKKPSSWGKLLGWVEWSYNTSWNSSSGLSPYEITFGKKPFNFSQYLAENSNIDVVNVMLTDREAIFTEIKKKLEKAQNRMEYLADKKRREAEYQVGDMVLVKLRPHRQISVSGQPSGHSKLAKRFYGPFRVVERIGFTTYKLQLPEEARIHPVFHCSLLKSYYSTEFDTNPHSTTLLVLSKDDHLLIQPLAILNTRRNKDFEQEVLV